MNTSNYLKNFIVKSKHDNIYLYTNLQILPNVIRQHRFQTFEWVFDWQSTKKGHQPLGIQQLSMDDRSFNVVQICRRRRKNTIDDFLSIRKLKVKKVLMVPV